MKSSISFTLGFAAVGSTSAFNLPSLDTVFKPPASSMKASFLPKDEAELIETISFTRNGKNADLNTQARVLSIVRRMETSAPPSLSLLSDPEEAKILDGDWYLQYTQPSEIEAVTETDDKWVAVEASEGESRIETRQFNARGSVSAGGIRVDTSGNSVAKQSFDISKSRVQNEVKTGIGRVTVGGSFRQSSTVPLRAIAAVDFGKIETKLGVALDISGLFAIRALLKGSKESGWLETTYISENLRIGRGNKGSLFVLTRDRDAVTP